MGKFKHGLLAGGLLGAGMMWLNTTKKGRAMRSEIMEAAHEVYGRVKEQMMASDQWETMSKHAFVQKVTEIVNTYAIENGLADNVKNLVIKVVSSQYQNIKKEMKKHS